jgi:DNA-binding GntR family transcriptional regulator
MMRAVTKAQAHRIHRQSLPEALAASLQERILNGEFKDGEPLIQETIAEEYEVSRMPVREALRQLEALGLIEMKTHRGAVVTAMQQDRIVELFDLRATLEGDIMGRALRNFDDEHGKRSEAILRELEEAYHRRDISRWGALNWQFHKSLYLPANRPETLAIIEGINIKTDRFIRLQLSMSGPAAVSNAEQEHRELLRLARARDEVAVDYLRMHIKNVVRIPQTKQPTPA